MNGNMNYLDRNEFNFEPAPEVKEAIKNFEVKKFCFYTRTFGEGKKSVFSEYLSSLYAIDEKQILIGYGGEDILKQVVHFFLTEEDGNKTMLIPEYSWWYYRSIADEVKGRNVMYPMYEEGNTFKYDLEGLKSTVESEQPKIILIASPNNPTGNMLTAEDLGYVMSFVPQSSIVLIDESYASYVTADNRYVKALIEKYPNIIIVRTLSKFYGLPGLRLGFGFMSASLERFMKYSTKYLGYNRLSEEIGIAVLKAEDYYRAVAESMNTDRRMYEKELGAIPGFKVYQSNANFILVKYPVELKDVLQEAFGQNHYKVKFMDEPELSSHIRITIGTHDQNHAVVETVKKAINL
ncbi:MAG: aminotransferase class I/II-fold pyridoxal phosphate-dependent enzyme [Tannerella sp.]|jgi:histidinol-phosphate aminotransferase|nr:aminotransferase class I/II-fold pyridoxal phosphate-dependent enzyme [Tannerella sp.]